jgi:Fe-S-cluster containining protein
MPLCRSQIPYDEVIAILHGMEKFSFADKESVQCAIVEIKEVRCDMNADFIEPLADSERFDEGRFWKHRREFEKKWRDPDDVYIDVERREEERKKPNNGSRGA